MFEIPPTQQNLESVGRWGRVAFAAKCGRRAQPLLRRFWPNPNQELLTTFDSAIALAESTAAEASPARGIKQTLKKVRAYTPAMAGMAQIRPYGAPAGRVPADQSVRFAVASTAQAALECANHAAEENDEDCVRDALDAYGWAVHATHHIFVAGLDRVLQMDLHRLMEATEKGTLDDTTPVSPEFFALESELATYRRELPELLEKADGRFALIHGDKVDGTWDTYEDALQVGYERYQLQPFLVKKIRSDET